MTSARVYDETTGTTLYTSETLMESENWLLERRDMYNKFTTFVDELDEHGNVTRYIDLNDLIYEVETAHLIYDI